MKVGDFGLQNNGILLHQQVAHWILRKIEDGTWPPHSQIASEPDLAKELRVSRGTLQKAINTLVEERRLYRIRDLCICEDFGRTLSPESFVVVRSS